MKNSGAVVTKVESDLEARIAACRGDDERVEVLTRARRFKASWIELGESLSYVMRSESYRRWGYETFEDYCRKELHLRKETAYKLTGSYTFLKSRAPHVLRRDGMSAAIPQLESVDFWKRAEEAEGPREALTELRQAVVDDAAPAGALKRRYKEVFFPTSDDDRESRERQAVLAAAQRLVQLLADTRAVPKNLAADVEEQLGRLVQALS